MSSESFSSETQQQAAAFDQIGEHYEAVFGVNENQIAAVRWLIERLPPNARVLDIGSGTGVPTARMLADAGHDVIGVDTSAEMVRIAQRQVPHATFQQTDAANLSFAPSSFHAITAFFSLLMMRRSAVEATLGRLRGLLQPPGYLVLSMVEGDFDYLQVPFLGQSLHVSAYPRDVFKQTLEDLSFTVLDSQVVSFQASDQAPPETQMFFFCQYQE